MRVEYENDAKNLVALHKRVLRSTDVGRKMLLHRHFMVQAVLVVVCGMFAVNGDRLTVLAVFVALSVLAWVLRDRAVVMKYKKDLKNNMPKGADGNGLVRRSMALNPDGLGFEAGGQEHRYAWADLEAVEADADNVYVMPEGLMHFVIPKSAFSPEQLQEFMETLKRNVEAEGQAA